MKRLVIRQKKSNLINNIMIRSLFVFIVMWCMAGPLGARETDAWIRINQLGYLPGDIKEAVLIAREEMAVDSFSS